MSATSSATETSRVSSLLDAPSAPAQDSSTVEAPSLAKKRKPESDAHSSSLKTMLQAKKLMTRPSGDEPEGQRPRLELRLAVESGTSDFSTSSASSSLSIPLGTDNMRYTEGASDFFIAASTLHQTLAETIKMAQMQMESSEPVDQVSALRLMLFLVDRKNPDKEAIQAAAPILKEGLESFDDTVFYMATQLLRAATTATEGDQDAIDTLTGIFAAAMKKRGARGPKKPDTAESAGPSDQEPQ